MAGEFFDKLSQLWEEEGLFSRDIDGHLIRIKKATEADYQRDVTLTVDGQEVTVKKAEPTIDSQGNIVIDENGRTIPRDTTIYDAAQRLYVKQLGDANPIPTLCHREHMRPVGVCRVCCVDIYRADRRGNLVSGGKLIPACHEPVKSGMIVHTIESPDLEKSQRLKNSVRLLTELMTSDHLHRSGNKPGIEAGANELARLAERMNCQLNRFAFRTPPNRGQDHSSSLIAVNHDACILCERCIRGCNEIKKHKIIGRSGKGYTTKIGFDLDSPMESSNCVSCGECMVACPTDALTFRKPVESVWHRQMIDEPGNFAVSPEELSQHRLFKSIPYRWLQWNQSLIVRRKLKKGDVLCRMGEYGSTAYILNSGEFGFWFRDPAAHQQISASSGRWLSRWTRRMRGRASSVPPPALSRPLPAGEPDAVGTSEDLILGEMTCMSFYPRSATVVATTDGEIYEVRRNVLYMLQRSATSRRLLDKLYRQRALHSQLQNVALFTSLTTEERRECGAYLKDRIELVRVDPGQIIYRQGEQSDELYIVRVGYVKVSQTYSGHEQIRAYLGPNNYFGEIGLLSELNEVSGLNLPETLVGKRTATCSALDNVELVRIKRQHFWELMRRYDELLRQFTKLSMERIAADDQTRHQVAAPLREFLNQGLFNAQKLLVLDLDSCTRCDECVKACADTHGGVTRLVREGLRFDKYLVASACRSCQDPYCMVGCPVDAIHREGSLEVKIEDHCIGCGICAQNCPYGNINMVPFDEQRDDPLQPGRSMAVVQNKATTCDLCKSIGVDASNPLDEVSCVYACPHNAAFRMNGTELLDRISNSRIT